MNSNQFNTPDNVWTHVNILGDLSVFGKTASKKKDLYLTVTLRDWNREAACICMSVTEVGQEKQPTTGPLSCVGKQETGVQSQFHVAPSVSFALAHSFFSCSLRSTWAPTFQHLPSLCFTPNSKNLFQPFPCSPPFLLLPGWASLPDQTGDGSGYIIKMLRVLLKISRGWMHVYSSPTLSSLS